MTFPESLYKVVNGFTTPNHRADCKVNHPRIRFAHVQKGAGPIPDILMFHVMSEGRSHHSTNSLDGLKEWEVI